MTGRKRAQGPSQGGLRGGQRGDESILTARAEAVDGRGQWWVAKVMGREEGKGDERTLTAHIEAVDQRRRRWAADMMGDVTD